MLHWPDLRVDGFRLESPSFGPDARRVPLALCYGHQLLYSVAGDVALDAPVIVVCRQGECYIPSGLCTQAVTRLRQWGYRRISIEEQSTED